VGSVFPFGFTDILAVAAEGSSWGAHFWLKVLSKVLLQGFIKGFGY
jgi:hypothetical protein